MRKVIVAVVALCGLAWSGSAVSAQYFGPFSATVTPANVEPGGSVTVAVQNCDVETEVTVTLGTDDVVAPCIATSDVVQGFRAPAQTASPGTATATLTAPTEPGTYTGSASGTSDGQPTTTTFQVAVEAPTSTVPATDGGDPATATLPSTGGDGVEPLAVAAVALVVVGLGLVVVTQLRRRQRPATP